MAIKPIDDIPQRLNYDGDKRKITNADIIRSMTDEELLEFFAAVRLEAIDYSDCNNSFRSWLRGSAYEDNGLLHNGVNGGFKNDA